MTIERLSKEELIEKVTNIFYDYMATGHKFYTEGDFVECSKEYPTPMDMLWAETQNTIKENKERQIFIHERLRGGYNINDYATTELKRALILLKEEEEHLLKSNKKYQKGLYERTGSVSYSRNFIRLPLDKLINSYYDDFILEVLFYDDIGVNNGIYDNYKALSSPEQRLTFIKNNTEITHMGLVSIRNRKHICTVVMKGNLSLEQKDDDSLGSIKVLGPAFSDLKNLTLAEINEIDNNDIKQFFQNKIDLDKEKLLIVADKNIGNDNYKILRDQHKEDLYIRYICPSTNRVYFNRLEPENLAASEYFKFEDYESYIDAWWSINNLGAPIEGYSMIRC